MSKRAEYTIEMRPIIAGVCIGYRGELEPGKGKEPAFLLYPKKEKKNHEHRRTVKTKPAKS